MSRKGGVGGGCKHITQYSASNQQPHLTSPCIKLRSSQSSELKGEELVSCSQIVRFTMQHYNALKVDSEYSSSPLQNDDGKALFSQQQRTLSPLTTTFKCLANQVEKRGSWRGLQAHNPTLNLKLPTPPNLPFDKASRSSNKKFQKSPLPKLNLRF